jgi:hypothetical protein
MAAGVADHVWSAEEIVGLLDRFSNGSKRSNAKPPAKRPAKKISPN